MSKSTYIKEYLNILVNEAYNGLLKESKQNIVNLGYPAVVASVLIEKFGNKAFVIAKWMRDYYIRGQNNDNWWKRSDVGRITKPFDPNLKDFIFLYEILMSGDIKKYLEERKQLGLIVNPFYDWNLPPQPLEAALKDFLENPKENTQKHVVLLKKNIKDYLLGDAFFYSGLMRNILSGELSDIKPYSRLGIDAAKEKYGKKRIFDDRTPVKTYPNGWRWIDTGQKCDIVGGLMKNCGSTGVMSMDRDAVMIVLFDKNNKPHVVVTYSPNQKRISSEEGVASSAVKEEYQDYVFDLAKTLGANFDFAGTQTSTMKIRGAFGPMFSSMEKPFPETPESTYSSRPIYKINLTNGEIWWSDGLSFASEAEVGENPTKEGIEKVLLDLRRNEYAIARQYNPTGIPNRH